MVYIQKIKCRGLYSFRDTIELDLTDQVVIVGPNNSGKSNILRILKVLVDTFSKNERLDYSKIYFDEHKPFLEGSLQFSEPETRKIVDFFSFHLNKRKDSSQFNEFKNYEKLLDLFNTATIHLDWTRSVEGESSTPEVRIEFPNIGLKFYGQMFGGVHVSNLFPEEHTEQKYNDDYSLNDLLQKLKDRDNVSSIVNQFFGLDFNEIASPRIIVGDTNNFSDKAKITLTNLFSFLGLSTTDSRDVNFLKLLGVIFQKNIQISSGNKGLSTKTILDFGEKLRTPDREMISTKEGDQLRFNAVLERRIFEKILDFDRNLESDGSNIVSFLFSLKNSPKQTDRTKFKNIQEEFKTLFESDKLSFDVIIQYGLNERQQGWLGTENTVPKIPIIMIQDDNLQRQFVVDQVGAGLLETIYLLTLAHGIENSVILLDEPAVNLHPTLMKSIAKSLQNPKLNNQFIIITHSPELTSYEIFDNKASIIYIRKKQIYSIAKILEGKTKNWFEENRHRLKHQIDPRIFFGKSVLLCEGDSDKNLLDGIVNSLEYTDSKINITQNDVVITHVGGKNSFEKYINLMKNFDIPYLVLGDRDAKTLFKKSGTINKNTITFQDNITIIDDGNLEKLMQAIDLDIYHKAEKDNGNSKPAVAFAFAEGISKESPEKLKTIKELLLKSIELAKGKMVSN